MPAITLKELSRQLPLLKKMYDSARVVDPVAKRVVEYAGISLGAAGDFCYNYWGKGIICENCISLRAHLCGRSFMKLEFNTDVIMLVTALPVESKKGPLVLELLKDATDHLLLGTGDYTAGDSLRTITENLNAQAVLDHLTGVYNRRYLDERLTADLVSASLQGQPVSLLFADIDDLRVINNTYGHAMGDLAILRAAEVLREGLRTPRDWVACYGGDEFVICLYNANAAQALETAKRLHERLGQIRIPLPEGVLRLTASIGVETAPAGKLTPDELLRMADRNLYRAKAKGKNRAEGPEN